MKYTQLHKIEEYNGTVFIGEDITKVFADHIEWCEEKKREIIRELHSGHGEIVDWLYNSIHPNDQIHRNHIFYFRPLTRYGTVILRNLIYELIPGLTIRNSISCFLVDFWYKVEPHFISFDSYNSDYSMIYEDPRGSREYRYIDECNAHVETKVVEIDSKEVKSV